MMQMDVRDNQKRPLDTLNRVFGLSIIAGVSSGLIHSQSVEYSHQYGPCPPFTVHDKYCLPNRVSHGDEFVSKKSDIICM